MYTCELFLLNCVSLLLCLSLHVEAIPGDIAPPRSKISTLNDTLRITTIMYPPYTMLNDGGDMTGFIPDLIKMISRRLGFEYELYLVPDGKYGSVDKDGRWNGMIGELAKRQYGPDGKVQGNRSVGADMTGAALVVTSSRESVVDFVKPFQNYGLTLLVRKTYSKGNSTNMRPNVFSVFRPLAPMVWLTAFIVLIVVGVLLGLMNHFNPYEWEGCYKRGQAQKSESESFSWSGSLWFVSTTMQWQGFERAPRSIAAKVLTCFWFAFVTLTLVTYIGSLVNHLWWASMFQTHAPTKHSITGLKDIVANNFQDFTVGCLSSGATFDYVRTVAPKKEEFRLLKEYWETDEGAKQFVSYTMEGVRRVRSGKYAFLMESLAARFFMNLKPCDLTTVGELYAPRSYGLAVPRNSPHLEDFHRVILELQEEGEIESLERKWWEGRGECWNVTSTENILAKKLSLYVNQGEPKVVDINMFWGVVVTMVIGIVACVVTAIGEILYYRHRGKDDGAMPSLPSGVEQ